MLGFLLHSFGEWEMPPRRYGRAGHQTQVLWYPPVYAVTKEIEFGDGRGETDRQGHGGRGVKNGVQRAVCMERRGDRAGHRMT